MNKRDIKNKELLVKFLLENDRKAYEELFISNLNLVHYVIVNRIFIDNKTPNEVDDEYFDVGCIGLHKAITGFDLNKMEETSFSAYAFKCIRNEVLMQIRKESLRIKPTTYLSEVIKSVDFKTTDETITYEEILIDKDGVYQEQVEDKIYQEYRNKKLYEAISKLRDRYKEIIELFYGLNGKERKTLKEIAELYGTSITYINKTIYTIRAYLNSQLEEFKQDYLHPKSYQYKQYYGVEKKKEKLEELYEKYGKEEVELAINRLNDRYKRIIELHSGKNGSAIKNATLLCKKLNIESKNPSAIVSKAYIALELKLEKKELTKIEKLYSKYGKEEVEAAINSLPNKHKKIIKIHIKNSGKTYKELSNIFAEKGIDYNDTNQLIYRIYLTLEKVLEQKHNSSKSSSIEMLYAKYGKPAVLKAIRSLDDQNKIIMNMYYGIGGFPQRPRKIAEALNIPSSEINVIISHNKVHIKGVLEKKKNIK